MNYQWDSTFVELFERCLERYRSGDEDFNGYYTEDGHRISEVDRLQAARVI